MVGSIGIETSAPTESSTAVPSVDPSASPGPTFAPEDHADDIASEGDLAADQAAIDALCPEVAAWWKSVGSVSLDQWQKSGTGVYATSFVLDRYTEASYAALQRADWSQFDTMPITLPAAGYGACILYRPADASGQFETVILTFTALTPQPMPGTLDHQRSVTLVAAELLAANLIAR
ncbi:MAG TPA: hypothetical protein VFC06_05705 [Demequina sp.]|nr:hypothetical protein [Demequina sp.]